MHPTVPYSARAIRRVASRMRRDGALRVCGSLAILVAFLAACTGERPQGALTVATITPGRVAIDAAATLTVTGDGFVRYPDGRGVRVHVCGVAVDADLVDPERRTFVAPPGGRTTFEVATRLRAVLPGDGLRPGVSDMRLVGPTGGDTVIEEAVTCYDASPRISEFAYAPVPGEAGRPTTIRWTTASPDVLPLRCTLALGDGSDAVAIEDCAGEQRVTHTYRTEAVYDATLTVADAADRDATRVLRIGIGNAPPAFDTEPVLSVTENRAYRYDVVASDADGDPLALSALTRPEWLTLSDHGDGTATLLGTPPSGSAGTHEVRLVAEDGEASAEQAFTLTVISTDTDLASIALASGTLEPAFDPTVSSYAATVPYGVAEAILTVTPAHPAATLTVDGRPVRAGEPADPIALSLGANALEVVVTAQDGTSTSATTVTVDRTRAIWTRQFGGSGDDDARAVAIDGAGGIVVVARTDGAIGGDVGVEPGGYVRRLDPAGDLSWSRSIGRYPGEVFDDVAVASDGWINLAGYQNGTGGVAGDTDEHLFAIPGGEPGWRQYTAYRTDEIDRLTAVAVAADTGPVVSGYTEAPGIWGGEATGGRDAYVRRISRTSGFPGWIRVFGTATFDDTADVALDPEGNVLVTGSTDGTLGSAGNAGGLDGYVRKFDPDGNVLWTHQFGTTATDSPRALATTDDGSVLVVGYTVGSLGPASLGAIDAFVRKLDADGVHLWTRQFGTEDHDYAHAIAVDADGNIVVAGTTYGDLAGRGRVGGSTDAYVRRLDANGVDLWTHQFGSESGDRASGVTTEADGSIVVVGTTFGSLEGASSGGVDAFVVKLHP